MTEMGEQVLEPSEGASGRGLGAIVGVLGLVAALTVAAIALDSNTPAAAAGLEQFDSCADLQAWTDDLQTPVVDEELTVEDSQRVDTDTAADGTGGGTAGSSGSSAGATGAPVPAAATPTEAPPTTAAGFDASAGASTESVAATGSDDSGTSGTNTVVEGVDEIDVIDRVGPDRLLVSRNGVLALVDLAGLTVVTELPGIPYDARVSVVDGLIFAAGSSNDGLGTEVRRIRLDGDAFVEEGTWTTPGYLLDARRTGDELHVVAIDQPYEIGVVPFEDGPVPCDQVWRPVDPATTPAATLVANLPGAGALEPTAVAEVTGSAGTMLVTDAAVYVATLSYDDQGVASTGLHRFDLESLTPTGSGVVPGSVNGPFAINEYEGNLRVATSATGGVGFGGRPIPIEGDAGFAPQPGIDVAPVEDAVATAPAAAAEQPPVTIEPIPTDPSIPTTSVPTTDTTFPETTVPETTIPETTIPETTVPETTIPETTVPAEDSALAEVFVLDTEGDLDVIGQSGRFGRDYETIQGVRFVGELAYVVTFLQTDPFWIVDLSDPTAPSVVGELQVPGFSGYLHPIGDGTVVGFGPDGEGFVAARLFDVSDPANPQLLDELRLGDDSPVAWDHHAFVSVDDTTFAVPVTDYPDYVGGECQVLVDPIPMPVPPAEPGSGDGSSGTSGDASSSTGSAGAIERDVATDPGIAVGEPAPDQICEAPTPVGGSTGAMVLQVEGGELSVVEDASTDRPDVYAERVVQRPGGSWLVLSYDRLVDTADGSELVLPTA